MDTENLNFENVANSIFADTNPFLCKWENLFLASKKGAVKTNFRYHINNFKSIIQNKNNIAFFQGLILIKKLVGLIWVCYYLFTTKDFFFLLTIPVSFVFGILIERLWYRRFIATFLSVAIIIIAGKLLNLSGHYYWFLTFIILISSQIHSVYNTFFTELFYSTENNFVIGVDQQIIAEIYDGITGKKHKGPFIMHKIKF